MYNLRTEVPDRMSRRWRVQCNPFVFPVPNAAHRGRFMVQHFTWWCYLKRPDTQGERTALPVGFQGVLGSRCGPDNMLHAGVRICTCCCFQLGPDLMMSVPNRRTRERSWPRKRTDLPARTALNPGVETGTIPLPCARRAPLSLARSRMPCDSSARATVLCARARSTREHILTLLCSVTAHMYHRLSCMVDPGYNVLYLRAQLCRQGSTCMALSHANGRVL